ncbi:MAG: acetoin utilization protein AcuC, partial [Longimicrobiales bacterium]
MRRAAFVWDDVLATYRFHPDHPLNPRRLALAVGLIRRLGLLEGDGCSVVAPRAATDDDLLLAHAPEFVEAVRMASDAGVASASSLQFGLGTEDVPVIGGMHEAARQVVGATLCAAEEVMSGRADVAFSVAGGLHHARRAEAAGFCVYNDLAVAIRWLQREFGARVMYIDIDAHHGDGVQWIFYDDPDVLTVSYHESGVYLFPGTGFVDELGDGDGHGYSVNVPLDAHTEDASFLSCFADLVPALANAFRPDVIVLQAGCDAHVLDPLTHLRCTTGLYERLVCIVRDIAHAHCDGRIIATGGGGYAIYRVVPRAWTLVWAALRGIEPADPLPADWLKLLRMESGTEVPPLLRDPADAFPRSPRR